MELSTTFHISQIYYHDLYLEIYSSVKLFTIDISEKWPNLTGAKYAFVRLTLSNRIQYCGPINHPEALYLKVWIVCLWSRLSLSAYFREEPGEPKINRLTQAVKRPAM